MYIWLFKLLNPLSTLYSCVKFIHHSCHPFLTNDFTLDSVYAEPLLYTCSECNWQEKEEKNHVVLVRFCAHTHTQSVIKCECAGGHLHELEVLERVHLYAGLCSQSSRGDRWEGGQVTLNIPSAPATERPLTPSITSTHSLEHTIWPCILSQDDFRHTYSTTAHHHTVSPGQKQDSERSKSMLYFMHKTQGFDNDKNDFISFAELSKGGIWTPMTFILWQKTLIQVFWFLGQLYLQRGDLVDK